MPTYIFYELTEAERLRAWGLLRLGGLLMLVGGLTLLAMSLLVGTPVGPDWPWTPLDGFSLFGTMLFSLLPLGAALFFWAVANYRVDRMVRRQQQGIARLDSTIRLWCMIWFIAGLVFMARILYVSVLAGFQGWPTGELRSVYLHDENFDEVGFSVDGNRILATTVAGRQLAWDTYRAKFLPIPSGTPKNLVSARTKTLLDKGPIHLETPDGKTSLRIVSNENSLSSYPVAVCDENGAEKFRLTGHSQPVNGLSITPDGKRALTASNDTSVRLWDLDSGKQIRTLEGHQNPVKCVQFSADGMSGFSGDSKGTILEWDLKEGKMRAELGQRDRKHSEVLFLSVSADGRRLLSSGRKAGHFDPILCLWDAKDGAFLAEFSRKYGIADDPTALSPDGRLGLAWGGSILQVWRLEN
jgi:WD40 repeat protein